MNVSINKNAIQKYDTSVNINSGVVDEVARKMSEIIEYADTRSGKQIKTDNVYNRYPSCGAENTGRKVFFAQEGGEVDDGRWLALPQQNLEDSMRRYVMDNSPRLYELSPSEDYSNVKETQRFHDFDFLKDRTFCRPVDFPFVFDEDEKIYGIPYGDEYSNSEDGSSGCAASVEKSVMDCTGVKYRRNKVDRDRKKMEFGRELIPYHQQVTRRCPDSPIAERLDIGNDAEKNRETIENLLENFRKNGYLVVRYTPEHFCVVLDMYMSYVEDGRKVFEMQIFDNADGKKKTITIPVDKLKWGNVGSLYQYRFKSGYNPRTRRSGLIMPRKI